MNYKKYTIKQVDDWEALLDDLLKIIRSDNVNIIKFSGDLGAGKTTAIKKLINMLGSEDEATSPSYSLINVYGKSDGSLIYHMDLYRLKSMEEAFDIGIEDYLYSGNLTLIEWPDVISPLLDLHKCIEIEINTTGDHSREVTVKY